MGAVTIEVTGYRGRLTVGNELGVRRLWKRFAFAGCEMPGFGLRVTGDRGQLGVGMLMFETGYAKFGDRRKVLEIPGCQGAA